MLWLEEQSFEMYKITFSKKTKTKYKMWHGLDVSYCSVVNKFGL